MLKFCLWKMVQMLQCFSVTLLHDLSTFWALFQERNMGKWKAEGNNSSVKCWFCDSFTIRDTSMHEIQCTWVDLLAPRLSQRWIQSSSIVDCQISANTKALNLFGAQEQCLWVMTMFLYIRIHVCSAHSRFSCHTVVTAMSKKLS